MDFSPIVGSKSFYSRSDSVSLEIRVAEVTSAADFAIFPALRAGDIPVVLDLLDKHVGVNAINEWGDTALMVAILNKNVHVFAELLNTRRPTVDVNHAKSSGFTALFYAVEYSSLSLFQALLRRGADANASLVAVGSAGSTPLHLACYLEKPKHAEALLEYGADPYAKNEFGQTPLQMIPAKALMSTKLNFKRVFEVRID